MSDWHEKNWNFTGNHVQFAFSPSRIVMWFFYFLNWCSLCFLILMFFYEKHQNCRIFLKPRAWEKSIFTVFYCVWSKNTLENQQVTESEIMMKVSFANTGERENHRNRVRNHEKPTFYIHRSFLSSPFKVFPQFQRGSFSLKKTVFFFDFCWFFRCFCIKLCSMFPLKQKIQKYIFLVLHLQKTITT